MQILLGLLVVLECFTGCFTMTDRIVTLSSSGVSTPGMTRAELSDALDIVDQVAGDNKLHLDVELKGTNLVASYVGATHGFFNNGTVYVMIHEDPGSHALIITSSDIPSYSRSETVLRIQKEIYEQFTTRFGKGRVAKTKKTMSDPGWFE